MSTRLRSSVALACLVAFIGVSGMAQGEFSITFNIESDPPGLNVHPTQMDGSDTISEGEQDSFWVRTTNWEPENELLIPYETTSHLYNLDSEEGGGPDYADGGHPNMTPRVIVTGASLRKGNADWPAPDHFDWYQLYSPTDDVVVNITYRAIDIPVSYQGDTGLVGPSVIHHEASGHSITLEEEPGYDVTDATASDGTLTDNEDGTWTLADVTDFGGVTITVTAEMIDPTDVPNVVFEDEPLTPEAAEAVILDAGLTPNIILGYSETVPEGYVLGQSIQPGTTVPGGITTVDIIVSQGPPPPMPVGWTPVLIVLMLAAVAVVGSKTLRRRTQQ